MTKTVDLLAMGEALVEFNQTQAHAPQYLQGFGGDTSNAAIAAARAGARSAYLSQVGDDAFGRMLMALWSQEGVCTKAVSVHPTAPTGVYFVTHESAGHTFSYLRKGSAASLIEPQSLPLEPLETCNILHVSAISQAISATAQAAVHKAVIHARLHGARIAFDPNLRLRLWSLEAATAAMHQVLPLTDVFMPSIDDIRPLCGLHAPDDIVSWGHAQGPRIVVLKLGADGVWVSDGQGREHLRALPARVQDATGAGDCFCGNLLARMALGDSLWQAARYANAAASLAVQGFGAVAPLPTSAQVLQRLARP